ncbi:MAG: M23 family metallopeptidase [Hyphomonadaceae bacterium]|nr:M23 family metallopeptidase [Hyphomonadaceae bacterium]MBC6411603.1 M23 family metallopeptidase [Hyphomonadaceae bacterium]
MYLCSDGEVGYYVLGTRMQVFATGAIVSMSVWCLLTILYLVWSMNPSSSPSAKIKARYERLLEDTNARYALAQAQLEEQQRTFERAARNFEQRHAAIAKFTTATGTTGPGSIANRIGLEATGDEILVSPTMRDPAPRRARRSFTQIAGFQPDKKSGARLTRLELTQNAFLEAAEEETLNNIEHMRAVIEATGMDVRQVLSLGQAGAGGPLINADDLRDGDGESVRILNMQARAFEARILSSALHSIPLLHPVDADSYKTSAFGIRRDPFTQRPAMHEGLDFASYPSAPIMATGDGVVTFAGRKGTYGRMVELDHGHGFVTRYAHLENTSVKRGQKVKRGEKLGGMGSTGRSTSTHVHYEVMFRGRAYDPENFLKAGQHYVRQK